MFDKLIEVLESRTGEKAALIQLLRYLKGGWLQKGLEAKVIPQNLLKISKLFLIEGLDTIEDFSQFVDLEVAFSSVVTEQDQQYVINKFKEFYPEEVDYILGDSSGETDPDSIRQASEELSRIASWFEMDIDEDIDSLMEHADKLEEERYRHESHDFESAADSYRRPLALLPKETLILCLMRCWSDNVRNFDAPANTEL